MKELICKNCGHSETLEKINGSNVTKILIAPHPRERKKDGLHIYPLYCLKCNYITEWAADSQNISAYAIDGIEYFKTFKINKRYKVMFIPIEDTLGARGYTSGEQKKYSFWWAVLSCIIGSIFIEYKIVSFIAFGFCGMCILHFLKYWRYT